MKRLFKITTFTVLLLCTSYCKKPVDPVVDLTDNTSSDITIDPDVFSENVVIKGGISTQGYIPESNGSITFELFESSAIAFLNEGFDTYLYSDNDLVGAYVIFGVKDSGDNNYEVANSYYDINLEENKTQSKSKTNKHVFKDKKRELNTITARQGTSMLDINFNANITAEEYVCFIAVYDSQGNVSESQILEISVKDWGGNTNLVGSWDYSKQESYPPNGDAVITLVNEEICEDSNIPCVNGTIIYYTYCNTTKSESYVFNTDGTFVNTGSSNYKDIKIQKAYDDCIQITVDEDSSYTSEGYWLYDSDENSIYIVTYKSSYTNSIDSYTSDYSLGNAYIGKLYNLEIQNDVFSYGTPVGGDLNGDGILNDDDSGYAYFYTKN